MTSSTYRGVAKQQADKQGLKILILILQSNVVLGTSVVQSPKTWPTILSNESHVSTQLSPGNIRKVPLIILFLLPLRTFPGNPTLHLSCLQAMSGQYRI